jgi:hypothetical protein
MEHDTSKVLSNDVPQPELHECSPLNITSEQFQQELDRLIKANPTFDCPSLRRPSWLNECTASFESLPWPRQERKFARLVANLIARITLR